MVFSCSLYDDEQGTPPRLPRGAFPLKEEGGVNLPAGSGLMESRYFFCLAFTLALAFDAASSSSGAPQPWEDTTAACSTSGGAAATRGSAPPPTPPPGILVSMGSINTSKVRAGM